MALLPRRRLLCASSFALLLFRLDVMSVTSLLLHRPHQLPTHPCTYVHIYVRTYCTYRGCHSSRAMPPCQQRGRKSGRTRRIQIVCQNRDDRSIWALDTALCFEPSRILLAQTEARRIRPLLVPFRRCRLLSPSASGLITPGPLQMSHTIVPSLQMTHLFVSSMAWMPAYVKRNIENLFAPLTLDDTLLNWKSLTRFAAPPEASWVE